MSTSQLTAFLLSLKYLFTSLIITTIAFVTEDFVSNETMRELNVFVKYIINEVMSLMLF